MRSVFSEEKDPVFRVSVRFRETFLPTGRVPGAAELGGVRVAVSGGGGLRQGYGEFVRQAQCLPEGGAAEPGQPLCQPIPRRTEDKTQVNLQLLIKLILLFYCCIF